MSGMTINYILQNALQSTVPWGYCVITRRSITTPSRTGGTYVRNDIKLSQVWWYLASDEYGVEHSALGRCADRISTSVLPAELMPCHPSLVVSGV